MSENPRITLITGCSSGLGLALMKLCLERGDCVIATARNAASIPRLQGRLFPQNLALEDSGQTAALVDWIAAEFGRIDLLINNAGYGQMGPLVDLSPAQLQRQFAVNCSAPIALTRAALALLGPGATVVNIGSVSAYLHTPFAGAYCASKAALHALSTALRLELAPFGIRVLTVRAGAIRSEFAQRASRELPLNPGSRYAAIAASIRDRAGLSQRHASEAAACARRIVQASQRRHCPASLNVARGSLALALLSRLPTPLLDGIMRRRFGLDQLTSHIK